jgi:two-component system cell cycle sensor histidine kinase/response regulator CckA
VRLRYLIGVLLLATLRRLLQPSGAATGAPDHLDAEEEPHRSLELYRVVVEYTDELIALVDAEGVYSYVSPSYERVLGHVPADLLGRNAFELLHPDDVATVRAAFASGLQRGEAPLTRARVRAGDGRWVVVEGTATLIRDERGAPGLVLSSARDVTGRIVAEEALAAAEQRYRSLVEHLPLVTYVDSLDELSSNLYTSPQIEPLLGYPVEQWTSDPGLFVRCLHPEDRERVLAEHARSHASGEPLRTEYRLVAKDGRVVWLQDEAVVVRDEEGRPLFLQGYLMDITRRKASEQALAERENLLQTIIETEPECVKLVAPDGRLLQMNRAGLEMIEADSLEQVAGTVVGEVIAPEHRKAFDDLTAHVIAGGRGSLEFEVVGLKGTRRRMETHAVPLHGADGEILGALSITRDVTERTRLEEKLRQSQKMEAVGRLAGGVAHDFNNLLTGIIGYADLLRAGLPPESELQADAEEVRKAADRAAALTRQLLAFSRRQVLQPQILSLNEAVREMERMLRRLIGEDVELVTDTAPDLGAVEADPGQIEQVIANLVVNARDAMPDGGRLVLRTANVGVNGQPRTEPQMRPGAYVLLSVSDTGTGMDTETQSRMFEPFFTTKDVGKGTGLGLATVYGIVKQSGGYIWVTSSPGAGTTFDIFLPRAERPSETEIAARPALLRPGRAGTETVLVVEDERLVRDLIARDLGKRGYAVLTAENGNEALAIVSRRAEPIDLLLTDVVMPELGGPELAARLTAEQPCLKVVYMTGYAERAVVGELAPWPLLQKPFNAGALAGAIREVLDAAAAA